MLKMNIRVEDGEDFQSLTKSFQRNMCCDLLEVNCDLTLHGVEGGSVFFFWYNASWPNKFF